MKKGLIILLVVIVLLVLPFIGSYNRLVGLDEQVNNNWSQVENQLQRRLDLIPNLVETVKGYAAHEKEVLADISAARAKLAGAQTVPEAAAADEELTERCPGCWWWSKTTPTLKPTPIFASFRTNWPDGKSYRRSADGLQYVG